MPFHFILKSSLFLILGSFLAALLVSAPSYAKGEVYTWSGDQIVGSGGKYVVAGYLTQTANSEFPATYSRVTNTTYRNYTGSKPESGKCGATLTLNSGRNKITAISVTCNIAQGAYSASPEATYTSGQYALDKTANIAGTPPKASDELDGSYLASIKESATYKAFGGKLDTLRTSYCNKLDDTTDKTLKTDCLSTGFQSIVYSCWSTARGSAASAARYDPNADTAKITKDSFASCMASKTGESKDGILLKIKDIDVAAVNAAGFSAEEAAKTQADKSQCTSGGGTWDDASNTCTAAGTDTPPETTCGVSVVGWIVCPVVNFLAGVTDLSYNFLADSFLSTPTRLVQRTVEGAESPIYTAWKAFQNVANILLVIGFLMIIYSQLTGVGLTNYSIKKMLPKIIVAALLINLSFYICAIAVDLSNVLGYGLKSFLSGLTGKDAAVNLGAASTGAGAAGFAGVAVAVLGATAVASAATGGVSLALVALIGVLISGAIALITIFFILMIRQVLIVFLIVIAPVAFAMYFLPNTKQWFDKWRKTFTALLFLFPIIGVVYGASTLASNVLTNVYTAQSDAILGQIIAAAVMILPLFVVPGLLKKSLDSVNSIGGKLNALGAKYGGKAKGRATDSNYAKYQRQKAGTRRAQMQAGVYQGRGGKLNPNNWRSGLNRKVNGWGVANTVSGGFTGTQAQRGAALIEEQEAKDIKEATIPLEQELVQAQLGTHPRYKGASAQDDLLRDRAKNGSTVADRRAAMNKAASLGRDDVLRGLQQDSSVNQEHLRSAISQNAGPLLLKSPDLVKGQSAAFNSVTGQQMSTFSAGTADAHMQHLENLHTRANDATLTAAERASAQTQLDAASRSFNSAIEDISADKSLQSAFNGETGRRILNNFSNSSPAFQSYANQHLTSLAGIDSTSGKIR